MAVGHHEDVIGFADEVDGQGLAAELADVDIDFARDVDGVGAGGLTGQGADTSGFDRDVVAILDQIDKKPFSHRAATDISCANK